MAEVRFASRTQHLALPQALCRHCVRLLKALMDTDVLIAGIKKRFLVEKHSTLWQSSCLTLSAKSL